MDSGLPVDRGTAAGRRTYAEAEATTETEDRQAEKERERVCGLEREAKEKGCEKKRVCEPKGPSGKKQNYSMTTV